MSRIAYVNGQFQPLENATVSILDRGFIFGDGIYEVTAVIDGHMVDNDLHLQRLQRSLGEVAIELPVPLERIEEIQTELIHRNALAEGLVYLQITRGVAERDFSFPKDASPSLVMFTQEKMLVNAAAAETGLKVMTCPDLRWARRDIKSISLLAQVLAKQLAVGAGFNEAWMLDGDLITEGASSTAYIVTHDNVIVTRPRSTATLAGCTRLALDNLLKRSDYKLEERPFSVMEALAAREAFLTSATTLVTAVVDIDGHPVGNGKVGPVTSELRRLYLEASRSVPAAAP